MTRRQPSVDEMTFANQILAAADERARRIVRAEIPSNRIGTVTAVDAANTVATVQLPGSVVASPGFVYAARMAPVVGDRVRVVILPTGDRYVAEVYGVASEGTAFPSQPGYGNNRPFYRTDRGLWYFYDGTRWLTTTLYSQTLAVQSALVPFSASSELRASVWAGTTQYLETLYLTVYVDTTHDGTNYWNLTLRSVDGGTVTTIVARTSISTVATAGAWGSGAEAINALLGAGADVLDLGASKVGTPGPLYLAANVTYRLVG